MDLLKCEECKGKYAIMKIPIEKDYSKSVCLACFKEKYHENNFSVENVQTMKEIISSSPENIKEKELQSPETLPADVSKTVGIDNEQKYSNRKKLIKKHLEQIYQLKINAIEINDFSKTKQLHEQEKQLLGELYPENEKWLHPPL